MGLCLYVGNRNYSSWSMRPGVLLRAFDIPFEEKLIRFDSFAPDSQFKKTTLALSPTGNVPILIDSDVQNRRGAPMWRGSKRLGRIAWNYQAGRFYVADLARWTPILHRLRCG